MTSVFHSTNFYFMLAIFNSQQFSNNLGDIGNNLAISISKRLKKHPMSMEKTCSITCLHAYISVQNRKGDNGTAETGAKNKYIGYWPVGTQANIHMLL